MQSAPQPGHLSAGSSSLPYPLYCNPLLDNPRLTALHPSFQSQALSQASTYPFTADAAASSPPAPLLNQSTSSLGDNIFANLLTIPPIQPYGRIPFHGPADASTSSIIRQPAHQSPPDTKSQRTNSTRTLADAQQDNV